MSLFASYEFWGGVLCGFGIAAAAVYGFLYWCKVK